MAAIKSALKQARESIQQKDFAKALEICQNEILKVESDNFMGLVFAGKCAYEMAKYADAKIFFHKATQCEPTNLLGWQGLAQIYEKTSELTEESLEASRKLLILLPENDKNRFSHQLKVTKFMLSSGQLDVALVNLNLLKEIASDDKESIAAFHHMVFDCCFKLTLSYSQKDLLQKVLASIEWILNNEASEENYEQSFIFWSKNLPDDQVFHLCDKYKDTFEEAESKMARLAARIYLATGSLISVAGNKDAIEILEELDENLSEDSFEEAVANALVLLLRKQYPEIIKLQSSGVDVTAADKHLLMALIGVAYLRMKNYWKAESVIRGCLSELKYPRLKLVLLEEAIVGQDNETTLKSSCIRLEKALLTQDLPEHLRLEVLQLLLLAYVKSGSIDKAKSLWDQHFRSSKLNGPTLNCLAGQLLICESRVAAAQQCFEDCLKECEDTEMPIARYWLAYCLWQQGDRSQRIFNELLKCVKADSYFAPAFYLLGRYYLEVLAESTAKALRCLERAANLNPFNEEISVALSDVYQKQNEKEKNLELLQKTCDLLPPNKAKWAWLRLAVTHMNLDCPEKAVSVLQNMLRYDEEDILTLECLADAYCARGSYESAVKSYEKVVKLQHPHLLEIPLTKLHSTKESDVQDATVFALYQIGQVKLIMKLFDEADSWFKRVLSLRPDYIPALVSMGEAYFLAGRHYGQLGRHQRLVDNFNSACPPLIRAANLQPSLKCVWKLLGDICTMIHPIPEELVRCDELLGLMELTCGTFMPKEFGMKLDILKLGEIFYTRVILLKKPGAEAFHDLGLNLMKQCVLIHELQLGETDMLNTARNNCVNSLKKAVRMDNKNPQYWGALGTAAATDAIDLKPLAQHSFIRSLELDPYSATYWVNLGVFYLKQGNSMLANQSFKRAEATDPTIPNIWTGQGLIAEQVGHVTMLEMLSHSTKLGYEPVGMISYGYHVVDRYVNESSLPEEERINAEIDIPRAADAMTIYAVTHPNDPCGWNLLGILRQTEKQYKSATKAFQTAQSCLDAGNDNKKKVEVNIRRCQQLLESTKMSTMDIPDFTDSGQLELYRWKHVYPWLIRG